MLCWTVDTVATPAQEQPRPIFDPWRDPILPRDLGDGSRQTGESPASAKSSLVRLFRMPSALPASPLGAGEGIDNAPIDASDPASSAGKDLRFLLSMGQDNPFLDFRLAGDPGGVGFYRFHSQVLLVDGGKTGLSMGLQAFTPAGLEADGVQDGATVLSPNFAWYHQIGDGPALQGFVGKNLRANSHWADGLERDIQYGLALHSPIPGLDSVSGRNLHLFLEALGRYHFETDPPVRTPANWELLPGVHWQVNSSWWLTGGILMPLGATRAENQLWQITCSWQF
jgi:hypothetical protein